MTAGEAHRAALGRAATGCLKVDSRQEPGRGSAEHAFLEYALDHAEVLGTSRSPRIARRLMPPC